MTEFELEARNRAQAVYRDPSSMYKDPVDYDAGVLLSVGDQVSFTPYGQGRGWTGSRYVGTFVRWVDANSIEIVIGPGFRELESSRIIQAYELVSL